MTEVEPRFKELGQCGCKDDRCVKEGTLTKHTYKDQTRHIRLCPCKQCLGRKSRKSGLSAQRRAAKALMVPQVGPLRPGNEEDYQGLLRMESKSGAIVKPMFTAYARAEAQSEASRPIGDTRPFVFCARVQPDSKEGLIVLRESRLNETVYALAVQMGLLDEP